MLDRVLCFSSDRGETEETRPDEDLDEADGEEVDDDDDEELEFSPLCALCVAKLLLKFKFRSANVFACFVFVFELFVSGISLYFIVFLLVDLKRVE